MSDHTPMDKAPATGVDIRDVVRHAIEEFVRAEQEKAEPAYKAELQDERKRREGLEARLNQLVEENRKARSMAEEADRNSQIRSELQRLGVAKVDLAFRAVKDEIMRRDDGHLQSKGPEAKSLQDYLSGFVQENPELLPARIAGGSGVQTPGKSTAQEGSSGVEIDKIRPGMNKDDLDRVRREISKLANQALRGV
ncbi:MAG: hypothetical protein JO340_21360 [Acidobacteriaceae bacterium]|nr:hypothetical protein [Acidobacteriaceae bacterium]